MRRFFTPVDGDRAEAENSSRSIRVEIAFFFPSFCGDIEAKVLVGHLPSRSLKPFGGCEEPGGKDSCHQVTALIKFCVWHVSYWSSQ